MKTRPHPLYVQQEHNGTCTCACLHAMKTKHAQNLIRAMLIILCAGHVS